MLSPATQAPTITKGPQLSMSGSGTAGREVVYLDQKPSEEKWDSKNRSHRAGVGLTCSRFPDGVVKIATVKPGSAANNSGKFARGQVVYDIDGQVVFDIGAASKVDVHKLNQDLEEAVNVTITVGPKPTRSTKFCEPDAVKEFKTIVGEFKGIEQFLEGIQGQIGLPFGNIERGMQMEVASDNTPFGASNNVGFEFTPQREYEFVASDHVPSEFTVPGFRDSGPHQAKGRTFVPLKIFLYATCARPLQDLRQGQGTKAEGYRGEIPKDLKVFVLSVLLRRAREAVLTGDALKNADKDWPKLKGLSEVARNKQGRAVLQTLRDVIHEAFSADANVPIDRTFGLPKFEDIASRVVEKWAEVEIKPIRQPASMQTASHEPSLKEELADLKTLAGIDKYSLVELALLAREKLRSAGLTREEIIGLRLYTGPLFVKMNGALRSKDSGLGTSSSKRYTNTIFAATSGMVKLSKVSPIPEGRTVYRGLSGIELPPEFWDNDTQGVKGGVEMAFLSTTTNMEVAIDYSNPGRDNMPFIFEIKVGAIDKGAALSFLSQFPEEDEILMPPRSFLEVVDPPKKIEVDGKWFGPAQEGGGDDTHYVWAIPVRINCNVQNFNIENFAKARQDLILSTVDQAIMEVREELSRMSTDSKYRELAKRPDDKLFASAPQVQILDAATNAASCSTAGRKSPLPPVTLPADPDEEGLPEDLPSFLQVELQRLCRRRPGSKNEIVSREVLPVPKRARPYGLPRIIVLVVSEELSQKDLLVQYVKEMKSKGVVVIAALAPKYRRPDADSWWPSGMAFLHDCKRVDLGDQDLWADKCRSELVPLVRQRAFLNRGKPEEYLLDRIKEEVDTTRQIFADENPAWFNDDFNFRLSMQEALNLGSHAMSKLTLYVEEPSRGLPWIVDLPQRTCHRLLVGKQRRLLAELHEQKFEREGTNTAIKLCSMTYAARGRDELENLGGAGDSTQKLFTWTPLLLHAADGNPELVRLLLAGKAQVNKQDEVKGSTALRLAAEYGCKSVVQVLLEHGASSLCVDKQGATAFLAASENGHLDVLKLLHAHESAALDRANDINYTPLMAAVRERHYATAKWLLEQRADVRKQTSDSGHSALIIAAESRVRTNVGMVSLLLDFNADPQQHNFRGWTPLMCAVAAKNLGRTQALLAAGADPDLKKAVAKAVENQRRVQQSLVANSDSEDGGEARAADAVLPAEQAWKPQEELQLVLDCLETEAEIAQALSAAMFKQKGLSEWSTAEVTALLLGFGKSFGGAAEVVEEYQMKGEDLLELMQIQGAARNPLYLRRDEGGLGLTDIQVRMLRRELRKRGLIEEALPRASTLTTDNAVMV